MIYIDRYFATKVGNRLRNFKAKGQDLYNFSCPYCGDSKKNKHKARGYLYRKGNNLFFRCHNCDQGSNLYNFLKFIDVSMSEEYSRQIWEDKGENKEKKEEIEPEKSFSKIASRFTPRKETEETCHIDLGVAEPFFKSLPDVAIQYCKNRKIPEEKLKYLYFLEKTSDICEFIPSQKALKNCKEPRIVFPFFDTSKKLYGFNSRAISKTKQRYLTLKLNVDLPGIYGLLGVNLKESIYVTEGPIDSLFLSNAIAVAGADMQKALNYINGSLVFVYDNEPRNPQICKNMERLIQQNVPIVIWPDYVKQKDVNDMVIAGLNVQEIVGQNTFSGLKARLNFSKWRK